MMSLTRFAISAVQTIGCMAAVNLGATDHCILGFFVAFAMVLLAWTEGNRGWGSSIPPAQCKDGAQ
jgi:hypothetical protein